MFNCGFFFFVSVCYMLDTARVNSRTIGLLQEGRKAQGTRDFARELVRELVTPHIKRRLLMPGVQKFVKAKAQCYFGEFVYSIKNFRPGFLPHHFHSCLLFNPHGACCPRVEGCCKMF